MNVSLHNLLVVIQLVAERYEEFAVGDLVDEDD